MPYTGSVSSQLGQKWVRQGNDVYRLNSDGSLGSKLSYEEFNSTYKNQGLNLDQIPQYDQSKFTSGTSSSSSQQQQQSSSTQWSLSTWIASGVGKWDQQPTLTIGGQTYRFNTPEEYIAKLQQLKSQGATGNLDKFIGEFQSVVPLFKAAQQIATAPAPASAPTFSLSNGGKFVIEGNNWVEYNSTGQKAYTFLEKSRDSQFITVSDPTRNIDVQLPLAGGTAKWSTGNGWNVLYSITPTGTAAGTPPAGGTSGQQSGSSAATSGITAVRRDNNNNFYVLQNGVERHIDLPEFQSLGINEKFVPAGQTVSLNTATGGQVKVGSTTVGGVTVDITKTPEGVAFKTSDAYKALSQEAKDFVDLAYNLIEVGGENEAKFFANAISQAQAVADPYFKTQLALAKAEVLGSIAEQNQDFQTKSDAIQTARDQLLEDVSSNKDFLSLEQQAEIARTIKGYDEDLLSIADAAAEKGITFATGARSRALAESRRGQQFSDVVQSSTRQYNFQVKELELKAARGDTEAQKQLADLQSKNTFSLQRIGRAAEEVLGSSNVPSISGFTPTGGALGKIEEEKRRTVISDVAGFLGLQKGFL